MRPGSLGLLVPESVRLGCFSYLMQRYKKYYTLANILRKNLKKKRKNFK